MKKRLAVIKPKDNYCFLNSILKSEYNVTLIDADCHTKVNLDGFDMVLLSFCSKNDNATDFLKNIENVDIPKMFVVSVINYSQLEVLYMYTDNVIFLPVSVSFLKNRINMILDNLEKPEAYEKKIVKKQFSNILQLQKTIKKIQKVVPDIADSISNNSIKLAVSSNDDYKLIRSAEEALKNNNFIMNFQPVIDISTNKLFGFEALIRWDDPEKGLLSPEKFIPVLEKSDIIYDLTYWIIEETLMILDRLNSMYDEFFRINVNICAHHFHLKELPDKIERMRKKYDVEPRQIGIEITESAFMSDMDTANINLLRLKSLGYSIYMDDFGSGYSSLAYLQHFPVEVVKIDKSFVTWMHVDEQSEMIVKTIVALAHGLNMKVVAEGVEYPEHIDMLKTFKCTYAQGFLYSKPLAEVDMIRFIEGYDAVVK